MGSLAVDRGLPGNRLFSFPDEKKGIKQLEKYFYQRLTELFTEFPVFMKDHY